MLKTPINPSLAYFILALAIFGFFVALFSSGYRLPKSDSVIAEVSGVVDKIEGKSISIKKADNTIFNFLIDDNTKIQVSTEKDVYKKAIIEDIYYGVTIVVKSISKGIAGTVNIILVNDKKSGIIESFSKNTINIKSDIYGRFSIKITDTTFIRTINSKGQFVQGQKNLLVPGNSISLEELNSAKDTALWIDVYSAKTLNNLKEDR